MITSQRSAGSPLAGNGPLLAALAYLALPNAIFLAGWFAPWAAFLGGAALVAVLVPAFGRRPRLAGDPEAPGAGLAALLLVPAIGWTALGGAGHLFHANDDWVVRDAVLRDLTVEAWPVLYPGDDGGTRVLRAPIAYYLPASLIGRALGLGAADLALLAWTATGVWLLLLIVVDRTDSLGVAVTKVLTIVFFSGMDVLGGALSGDRPGWTSHLEWWAGLFQYSSHTTQLFWVPGHALPGWIAAALIYRRWTDPDFARQLPALLALVPLWSPLAAIGVLPLAVAVFLDRLRRRGFAHSVAPSAWAGALVLSGLVGAFITADGERIRSGWIWQFAPDLPRLALQYILFVILEYLLLWRLVLSVHRPPSLVVSGVFLALLPMYLFGPGNDLAMRASIPALMVVALALADALPRLLWRPAPASLRGVTLIALVLGCATPSTEIARALTEPRWSPSPTRRVVDATEGNHYLADSSSPRLAALLRRRSPAEAR